jgi:hypothetical protein
MCSDAPDQSGVNAAAIANAEISKEALDFYKQVYAEQAPARAEAAAVAKEVSQRQLESSKLNDEISKDYWDYQKNTFRPLEEGIVAEAQAYDTAERREAEAGTAVADVGMQAQVARDAQTRQQQRMGVNPNSGAAVSMQNVLSIGDAAAKAGAAGAARKNVETVGRAMKMDAASLGRNLASSQATSASVALSAGDRAVVNASAPQQQAQSAASMMGQGFQTSINGNSSAGQLFGQAANAQAGADAANGQALGGLAGAGMMAVAI